VEVVAAHGIQYLIHQNKVNGPKEVGTIEDVLLCKNIGLL